MSISVSLTHDLPDLIRVGGGTRLFLSGRVECAGVPSIEVVVADVRSPVVGPWREAGPTEWGFASSAPLEPGTGSRSVEISLDVSVGGRPSERIALGEVPIRDEPEKIRPVSAEAGLETVAICLATHEPNMELLQRQIDSIRGQSHTDWILLISDDASSPEIVLQLEELEASDSRVTLSAHKERLGFYGNFERGLSSVPSGPAYVALADQDDLWHEDKLTTLLASIDDAQLAYADMRVVDEGGRVIQPSYWGARKNNSTNLSSLLLANTVTGAASLFKRSLLDLVLPFPQAPGGPFHDHWIAAAALATGRIAYVDRPLHDYVQHEDAALGHAAAMRGYRPRRLIGASPRRSLARIAEHGARTYVTNAWRLAIFAQVLEMRCGDRLEARKRRAIARVARLGGPKEPLAWLALRNLRRLAGFNETMGIEMSLLTSAAWRRSRSGRRATR